MRTALCLHWCVSPTWRMLERPDARTCRCLCIRAVPAGSRAGAAPGKPGTRAHRPARARCADLAGPGTWPGRCQAHAAGARVVWRGRGRGQPEGQYCRAPARAGRGRRCAAVHCHRGGTGLPLHCAGAPRDACAPGSGRRMQPVSRQPAADAARAAYLRQGSGHRGHRARPGHDAPGLHRRTGWGGQDPRWRLPLPLRPAPTAV